MMNDLNTEKPKSSKVIWVLLGLTLMAGVGGGLWYFKLLPMSHSGMTHVHDEGHYTCGMHPSVKSDKPGSCPICGMDLVKVESEVVEKTHVHYTCEMHPSVKSDKPGSCSICGMDLTKVESTTVASNTVNEKPEYFTCGMHPSVKMDKMGKCPICRMDLVPVFPSKGNPGANVVGTVRISLSKNAKSVMEIKTVKVESMILHKTITVSGKFDFSEKRRKTVAARIDGRIEKLYVDYMGASVKKGQRLLKIYSPDLVTTQQEYLQALDNLETVKSSEFPETKANAKKLVDATRQRLRLWGVTAKQIWILKSTRKVRNSVTVYSPISGVVVKKSAVEGKYFKEGENFFEIADLSRIWLYADIFESDVSWMKKGLLVSAVAQAIPGKKFVGRITFVTPFLDPKTRTVQIRAEFANPKGELKPEMFANVSINIPTPKEILAVPKSAVLDTGTRKIVYVKKSETEFVGKRISVGVEAENYVHVLSGLKAGELVVKDANFLIDSQSQLTGGQEGLYGNALELKSKEGSE